MKISKEEYDEAMVAMTEWLADMYKEKNNETRKDNETIIKRMGHDSTNGIERYQ